MCRASYSGWMEAWHNFIHVHSSGFAKSTQTAVLVPANSNIRMMYIVIYLSHISSISCLRLRSMKWSACSIANTFIVPCPHDAHVLILLDYQRASLQSFPLSHQQLDGKCTPCCKGNLIVLALTYWPQVWLCIDISGNVVLVTEYCWLNHRGMMNFVFVVLQCRLMHFVVLPM